ncbi:MAG: DNA polymerase III subunit beta [Thermodesulfobacteriota bacterium]
MELTIPKQSLYEGLQLVQGIIEKRSSMPILSNVLIETFDEGIFITATDLQVGVKIKCPASITEQGAISIIARKFFEIVRELPDEDIYIKLKENNKLYISCKDSQFNISGLPAVDFPPLPEVDLNKNIILEGELLKDMIQKTIISVSLEEGRYNLSGIYFEYLVPEGGNPCLRMVSTDGHRLTMMDREIEPLSEGIFPKGVLLPRKAVTELIKILEKPGPIQLGLKEKFAVFQKEDILMIIRLLESNFPDYTLVLPKKKDKEISISKNHLLETMKRMGVLASEKYKGVRFSLNKGNLEIRSINPDIGEAKENIPLNYKGAKLSVGFNARFFIDALQVMDSDSVSLEFNESVSPALIKGEKEPGFLALIMPMKLSDEEEINNPE